MTSVFAPIGADAELDKLDVLSWIPVAAPGPSPSPYYAFPPGQLLDLYSSAEDFARGRPWDTVREILAQLHEVCRAAGAEFLLVYAPSKAHVILPLARDALPPEKVRAFAALRAKEKLPDGKEFLDQLFARLDVRAQAVAEWCGQHDIGFLDLTGPLRGQAADGKQGFYTYDDHWTPLGHEVVAEAVQEAVRERLGTLD